MKVVTYSVASYCRIVTTGPMDDSLKHLDEITNYINRRWETNATKHYIDNEESVKTPLEERKSGAQMFKDAKAGLFDAVVMRAYPRLTNNVEEFFRVYSMFDEINVPIFFIHDPAGLNVLAHLTQAKKSHEDSIQALSESLKGKAA